MSLVNGLLNQKIDFIYSTTKDIYGDVTLEKIYSAVACRWQEKINRVLNIENEEITTTIEVWLTNKYSNIAYSWQFEKDNDTYAVQKFSKKYGLDGSLDHIKVYLS